MTQTIDVPADRRITLPREVPTGPVIITFTQAALKTIVASSVKTPPLPGGNALTAEEALQMAEAKAADPNRKPISRHFGKHKGILGGDGVAYQRALR